jgi:hypothetical protein
MRRAPTIGLSTGFTDYGDYLGVALSRPVLALVADALERGLPILGSCRGMQLLNVAPGGTLYPSTPTTIRRSTSSGTASRRSPGRTTGSSRR